MNTVKKIAGVLEDKRLKVRIRLSSLWISLMLFYIYADILGFYTLGIIENVISGERDEVKFSEGLLFAMSIWMAIPSVMVFLSLTLRAKANRLVNILIGIVSIVILGVTSVAGEFSIRYTFQAICEGALMASIVWHAWKWPKKARTAAPVECTQGVQA